MKSDGGSNRGPDPAQLQALISALQQKALEQQKVGSGNANDVPPKEKKKLTFKQKLQHAFFFILTKMQSGVKHIDRFINFVVKPEDSQRNEVAQYARPPILFGTFVVIVFVGLGGLWMSFAPLDSAAVALGTVISSTKKKLIQHAEGGIIQAIHVKIGDHVKAHDPLITLDDAKFRPSYEVSLNDYRNSLATESRLIAERDSLDDIEFPEFLLEEKDNPVVAKIMRTQRNLFNSKRNAYASTIDNQEQKKNQHKKQIEGIEARKVSTQKNFNITSERVIATKELVAKGFVQKVVLLELQTKQEDLKSSLAYMDTEIAKAEQDITKTDIEITHYRSQFLSDVLKELKETQANVTRSREQFHSAKDALERSIIRSPVDGIVNDLNYHTVGGVIPGGGNAPIAEIAPSHDALVIEAQIPTRDIASITVGLTAKVRFSAFKSRTSPVFRGTVTSLSPDSVQRPAGRHGERISVYIATVEIDMQDFNKIAKAYKLTLVPGMQAEVYIIRGSRTLLRYLMDPIVDQMFKAFTEK